MGLIKCVKLHVDLTHCLVSRQLCPCRPLPPHAGTARCDVPVTAAQQKSVFTEECHPGGFQLSPVEPLLKTTCEVHCQKIGVTKTLEGTTCIQWNREKTRGAASEVLSVLWRGPCPRLCPKLPAESQTRSRCWGGHIQVGADGCAVVFLCLRVASWWLLRTVYGMALSGLLHSGTMWCHVKPGGDICAGSGAVWL